MIFSYEDFTGDGVTTDFAVNKPYINQSHVLLKVNSVSVPFTWVNASLVRADVAPAVGTTVRVERSTPVGAPLVNYVDGSTLDESDLDLAALQLLYVAQESYDSAANLTVAAAQTAAAEATTSAAAAAMSETNAAASAAAAAASEAGVAADAAAAASSASASATSATGAATSETNAAGSASGAASSASAASTSATNAAASAASAAASAATAVAATAYDIPFIAGYTELMAAESLTVRAYAELVVTRAFAVTGAFGLLQVPGVGAAVIVDIEQNGVSVFSVKPRFADGASALTPGVIGSGTFLAGDRLTFRVTQVGSTTPGGKLAFSLVGTLM